MNRILCSSCGTRKTRLEKWGKSPGFDLVVMMWGSRLYFLHRAHKSQDRAIWGRTDSGQLHARLQETFLSTCKKEGMYMFWSNCALEAATRCNLLQSSLSSFTPVTGSIFRPLSQTHICKRELKNDHISRFCSVFQIIQVISSAKFFSAEEVDLRFNSETKEHPQISNASFWKRDRQNVFLQMF